jgi:hypothetical protein
MSTQAWRNAISCAMPTQTQRDSTASATQRAQQSPVGLPPSMFTCLPVCPTAPPFVQTVHTSLITSRTIPCSCIQRSALTRRPALPRGAGSWWPAPPTLLLARRPHAWWTTCPWRVGALLRPAGLRRHALVALPWAGALVATPTLVPAPAHRHASPLLRRLLHPCCGGCWRHTVPTPAAGIGPRRLPAPALRIAMTIHRLLPWVWRTIALLVVVMAAVGLLVGVGLPLLLGWALHRNIKEVTSSAVLQTRGTTLTAARLHVSGPMYQCMSTGVHALACTMSCPCG